MQESETPAFDRAHEDRGGEVREGKGEGETGGEVCTERERAGERGRVGYGGWSRRES